MRVAALDLGTNTFLCLIVDGTGSSVSSDGCNDDNKIGNILYDESRVVRLGQGLAETGELHPDALDRAKNCLKEFKAAIEIFKPEKVLALATSAARDAKNSQLLFEMGNELQIPIEIITGEREAQMTYWGATDQKRRELFTLVIDVGGGSTEFILGKGSQIIFSKSLDIGCVRLTERFIRHQPIGMKNAERLCSYLEEIISSELLELKKYPIDQAIAVAGTPTSIVAAEIGGFTFDKVHGYVLNKSLLETWRNRFRDTSVDEKIQRWKIEKGRADVIYVGSEILNSTMAYLNVENLIVSAQGVRFGIAQYLLNVQN